MSTDSVSAADPAILALTAAVEKLSQRVELLENRRGAAKRWEPDDETVHAIEVVRAATKSLFGSDVVVDPRVDPEIDEQYFVFRVKVSGNPEDAAQAYREWHRKVGDWAPTLESQFRLAVEFDEE